MSCALNNLFRDYIIEPRKGTLHHLGIPVPHKLHTLVALPLRRFVLLPRIALELRKGDMVFRIPYLAQNRVRAHLAGAGHHEEDVEGKEARHEEEERHRVQEVALRALKRVKGRSNSGPSEKTLKKISMERFPSMLKPVHETQCTFLFNLLHRLSTRSSAAERLLHIKFHPSLHDDSF